MENLTHHPPKENITTTIDAQLQAYGEELMRGKRGSVVAIEPSTGEILCLISAPSYDPNKLVGKEHPTTFFLDSDSLNKPLYNRAALAQYPPGSTFKLVNALIGLQEKPFMQVVNTVVMVDLILA